jgi:hypothetical protein
MVPMRPWISLAGGLLSTRICRMASVASSEAGRAESTLGRVPVRRLQASSTLTEVGDEIDGVPGLMFTVTRWSRAHG